MKTARFTGPDDLVEIGGRPIKSGETVGEPGSVADVTGCIGVVGYLLKRRDFVAVEDCADDRESVLEYADSSIDDDDEEE